MSFVMALVFRGWLIRASGTTGNGWDRLSTSMGAW